jgi:hypothetical protein
LKYGRQVSSFAAGISPQQKELLLEVGSENSGIFFLFAIAINDGRQIIRFIPKIGINSGGIHMALHHEISKINAEINRLQTEIRQIRLIRSYECD